LDASVVAKVILRLIALQLDLASRAIDVSSWGSFMASDAVLLGCWDQR
jgi:hypothetical protein